MKYMLNGAPEEGPVSSNSITGNLLTVKGERRWQETQKDEVKPREIKIDIL